MLSAPWAPARLSIVSKRDADTFCFTKGYYETYDKSAGSYYYIDDDRDGGDIQCNSLTHLLTYLLTHLLTHSLTGSSELYGKVRFFSPKESLRIAGFPSNFTFPSTILLKNQYAGTLLLTYSLTHSLTHLLSHSLTHSLTLLFKVIGNSISVALVSRLMRHFFQSTTQ